MTVEGLLILGTSSSLIVSADSLARELHSSEPGRIFPRIQPATICWIELTSDKNQAKPNENEEVWAQDDGYILTLYP